LSEISVRRFVPALESSARTAAAATVSFLIASLFGMREAYWAAILTLVIMQSTLGAAWSISIERFVGTVFGALTGGLLASYFPQTWWIFLGGVFVLGLICASLRSMNSYRFAAITMTIIMMVPRTTAPWMLALHRFLEVSIGIVVGLAMTAVWPEREKPQG
jgi:uncharacterized membrane protein YccC